MPRVIWKGSVSFGLVTIPVQIYSAVSRKNVRFNQLDAQTGARVRHKRVSSADGSELPAERIVKGYELPSGDYVTVTDYSRQGCRGNSRPRCRHRRGPGGAGARDPQVGVSSARGVKPDRHRAGGG